MKREMAAKKAKDEAGQSAADAHVPQHASGNDGMTRLPRFCV